MLRARGWRNLRHNVRIGRVQVDILGISPTGVLTLVEVKMSTRYLFLSDQQRNRLFRAGLVLGAREPVELILATIVEGRLHLLPVDGLTV